MTPAVASSMEQSMALPAASIAVSATVLLGFEPLSKARITSK